MLGWLMVQNEEELLSNQQRLWEYKDNSECILCRSKHHLQFHHYNPRDKIASVVTLMKQGFIWEVIQEEIDKCVILCEPCHSSVHKKNPQLNRRALNG